VCVNNGHITTVNNGYIKTVNNIIEVVTKARWGSRDRMVVGFTTTCAIRYLELSLFSTLFLSGLFRRLLAVLFILSFELVEASCIRSCDLCSAATNLVVSVSVTKARWGSRDRMVVGFTTTCAISAYHHKSCEFEPRSWRGVLDATLCDKICQ
jgi:hypothetical protein